MKTILSIDFDIIMDSSAALYGDKIPIPWEEKFKMFPILQSLPVNANTYSKINQFLLMICGLMDNKNIHFITDHHDIINYLDNNEKYNVINIDHHHDWCYAPEDWDNKIKKISCGNWVKRMYDLDILGNFAWIRNGTSTPLPPVLPTDLVSKDYLIYDFNLLKLPMADELFICFSPEYVPSYYHSLFFSWIDNISVMKKNKFILKEKIEELIDV